MKHKSTYIQYVVRRVKLTYTVFMQRTSKPMILWVGDDIQFDQWVLCDTFFVNSEISSKASTKISQITSLKLRLLTWVSGI